MKVLQVKYCPTEEELNKFLRTLSVSSMKYPYVHNIQYLPKVYGNGVEKNYADKDGITATADVGCDIVAIVQYFVEEGE